MYVNLGICNDGLQTTKDVKPADPLMHELLFLAEYYSDDGFQAENLSPDTRAYVAPLMEAVQDRCFDQDEFQIETERGRYDQVTLQCLRRYDWSSCAARFLETAEVDGNFTERDRQKLSLDYACVLSSREGQAQQAFDRLFDSYVAARVAYDRTGEDADFDWLYSIERAMKSFVGVHGEEFFMDILKRSSRGNEGHVMVAYLLAHIGWQDPAITNELVTNIQHADLEIRRAARYAFEQNGLSPDGEPLEQKASTKLFISSR